MEGLVGFSLLNGHIFTSYFLTMAELMPVESDTFYIGWHQYGAVSACMDGVML